MAGDTPPPDPPGELASGPVPEEIHFNDGAHDWIARLSGKGAAGTGSYGLGLIEAVHFYHRESPDRPVLEALLARGRFAMLYDVELVALLAKAVPIVEPGTAGSGDVGTRG